MATRALRAAASSFRRSSSCVRPVERPSARRSRCIVTACHASSFWTRGGRALTPKADPMVSMTCGGSFFTCRAASTRRPSRSRSCAVSSESCGRKVRSAGGRVEGTLMGAPGSRLFSRSISERKRPCSVDHCSDVRYWPGLSARPASTLACSQTARSLPTRSPSTANRASSNALMCRRPFVFSSFGRPRSAVESRRLTSRTASSATQFGDVLTGSSEAGSHWLKASTGSPSAAQASFRRSPPTSVSRSRTWTRMASQPK